MEVHCLSHATTSIDNSQGQCNLIGLQHEDLAHSGNHAVILWGSDCESGQMGLAICDRRSACMTDIGQTAQGIGGSGHARGQRHTLGTGHSTADSGCVTTCCLASVMSLQTHISDVSVE